MGCVALLGVVSMVLHVAVIVPGLAVAVVNLGNPDASLGQSSGDQAGVGEFPLAVQGPSGGRFLAEVEGVSRASNCIRKAISSDWIRPSS